MVKHIVLWKLKDSADKQQNIDRMIEMLNALVGKVEGLISVEVGYNFNTSSDFDVVLYAALKNPAALKHYQFHPEHLKCKDFIGSVTVDRVAADYFFEEEAASSLPADQVADVPAAAETVLASDETDVITEPEISIEFPPKRTVIPTVTELNADKPARKTEPAEEIPSVKIPYDPSITPEIVVRRPPLWEDEVFPAQTRNTVTDQSAATPADDAFAPAAQEFNAPSDPFAASFTEPVPADDAFAPAAQEFDAPSNPFAASFTEPALADDAFAPAAQEFDAPSDPFAASFTEPVPADDAFAPAAQEFDAPSDPFAASFTEPALADDAFAPAAQEFDAPSDPFAASFTEPVPADDAFAPAAQEFDAPSDPFAASFTEPAPTDDAFAPAAQEFDAPSDPFAASFTEPAPKSTPDNAQVNPVSTKYSKVKEKTSIFGKKTVDVDVTPLDQRSDTWTCPNCGKIMPNYVGTCGCGEPKPFEFEPPMPSDNAPAASAVSAASAAPKAELKKEAKETPKADTKANARTAMPKSTPDNAQVNPVSTEYSKVKEKTSIFGKKTVDVDVTPLDQRSDTWTCPNCGKIMPNYVGTCGCGEPKPFEFEPPMPSDNAPAASAVSAASAAPKAELKKEAKETPKADTKANARTTMPKSTPDNAQVNPVSTKYSKVKEKTSIFGKKTVDVDVTPLDQRSDTWTCPNCGKIMPNYVGTCGCGEPKPFEFEPPMPSDNAPAASAVSAASAAPKAELKKEAKETPKADTKANARTTMPKSTPDNAQVNPVSTKYSKVKEKTSIFGKKTVDVDVTPLDQRSDTWTCPNCGKIMPNYVGTCGCGEPKPFEFEPPMPSDNAPAASAVSAASAAPKAELKKEAKETPKADTKANARTTMPKSTPDNAQVNPVSTKYSKVKEKTSIFGKKTVDVDVTPLDQRSDTWTCPNCGKIMPNYVGTCGCGEPKPFEFEPPMPSDNAPAASAVSAASAAPKAELKKEAKETPKADTKANARTAMPKSTPDNAQVNPVSTEYSKVKEKTSIFGKKTVDVDVTPLDQRSDTWTCPNCGKIMPNYVGTCGCGEPKPFEFEPPMPSDNAPAASAVSAASAAPKAELKKEAKETPKADTKANARTTMPKSTPDNAQVNPVSTKYSKVKEKTSIFGKKTVDVDVTPLDQRSDTWTCPNCGKIMPNYVGTCGCGEPKPFEFEPPMPSDNAPAASAVSAASAAPKAELKKEAKETPKADTKANARTAMPKSTPDNAQVNPVSTEYSKVKEKTSIFGKKTVDVDVTPLDQRSDTWTCPNCGKIMPNYVGTCGCGEPKPFEFEPPIPTDSDTAENTEALPDIAPGIEPKSKLTSEQMAAFENVQPSIQGYNPQLKQDIPETQGSTYSYIQNDTVNNTTDPNYQAPDLSFIQNQNETFNNDATNNLNTDQDFTAPLEPFNFGDAPEAAPMRFENNNFEPMNFDNLPPVAPMRFSDEPPAYLGIKSDPKPEASKSSQPGKSEKPAVPEYKRVPVDDFSTAKSTGKKEKKHLFGKKAKEAEVFKKAQEAVNSRKDVPNNGTWTCPNCGKVMPKYVGTCGCGEPQPFEF